MFTLQELIEALSEAHSLFRPAEIPAFVQTLQTLPPDDFQRAALLAMRAVCARRMATQDCLYFDFTLESDRSYSFQSSWVGRDECGIEQRLPSPVNAMAVIESIRELCAQTVYVLHSPKEVSAWIIHWRGRALLSEHHALSYFPLAFSSPKRRAGAPRPSR